MAVRSRRRHCGFQRRGGRRRCAPAFRGGAASRVSSSSFFSSLPFSSLVRLVGDAYLVFEIIIIFYRKISCASFMARSHNLHLPSPPPFSQPSHSVFLVAPGIVQRTVDDTVMHISAVDMLDPSAASVLMAINSTIVKTSHITCTIAGFNATLKVWSGQRQYRAWVRAPTHGSGDCCCEPPCPC